MNTPHKPVTLELVRERTLRPRDVTPWPGRPGDLPMVSAPLPAPTAAEPRPQARSLAEITARAARSRISVVITGETGVGKEVLARKLHQSSPRADRAMVCINCAGLCESLVESELFGHERGAFTGATAAKPGLIEMADGGTLFLDEVGELPLGVQAKLLRVIETREVLRVGAVAPRPVDVRFVAATNRDLESEIANGRFRADLLFRLDGVRLFIPPLRERPDELDALAHIFVDEFARREGMVPPVLEKSALATLRAHAWPGNVRELRNVIERAVLLCDGGRIRSIDLLLSSANTPLDAASASDDDDSERSRIMHALAVCAGNQTRAAEVLGISRRTLCARLDELDLPRPRKETPGRIQVRAS